MVFSSPGFLFLFFPLFYLMYFALPRGWRNSYILLASFVFYVLGAGALTVVALVLLLANWLLAGVIGARREQQPQQARALLAGGIALNLLPLLFFKYLLFLAQLLQDLSGWQATAPVRELGIVLPLGISFYVFHFLSYLLDVHAGRIAPERSLQKFAIYIFLFPHLIAGPVVRYAEVREQLHIRHRAGTSRQLFWGLLIFIVGLSKKLLIADPLGVVADGIYRPGAELSAYSAWLGAACYSFQIYFDFSGYTDMAIGLARIMGFRFPRNFNRPYAAASITEFWQRWHMTLSRFFRDYVYIPLGGNRGSAWRTYRNLMVVFVLCALWHGAAYTFLAWGVGHGLLLVLERAGWLKLDKLRLGSLPVFVLATLLWVPFRAPTLAQAGQVLHAMFGGAPAWLPHDRMLADPKVMFVLALAALVCLLPDRSALRTYQASFRLGATPLMTVYCLALYVLSCMAVVEGGFNPFIYFQF
ncbi:alginate O-acetyltransferase complex protein AlgI [Duganella sp. CF402]|uniref:MBOAT family O-acyltransferase n=1 Tax=unclassified Duganella TaxID=2636909 RepID=UPI0008BDCCA7|nr:MULTISPECIES: MBOAT family O-acyltransferase [unclassified Duganella]RZT08681.1 alginate O-acetyltransferase complex protein AlgI [Duganella sp. BK701]SEL85597.1 alginate O-acetyltransferase complex protein AlgI [Duganella sp. CF402]